MALSLKKFNQVMAGLHAVQGIAVVALAKEVTFPINLSFLTFNPATQALDPASHTVYNLNVAYLVAAFLFVSALAHLIISTVYYNTYAQNLKKGINKARWFEYSISASIMMVGIAVLVGIYDLATLLLIFGSVSVMNLMGLVMEVHNQTTKATNWVSFWIGCLAGILPWLAVGLFFVGSNQYGSGEIPTFVYWIYVSLFIFFNCFALNMYLQYKKIGPWKNYLYGERVYIILSLVAKSLLAWQVFIGALRP